MWQQYVSWTDPRQRPASEKPRLSSGASLECAREDSNLHGLLVHKALNREGGA